MKYVTSKTHIHHDYKSGNEKEYGEQGLPKREKWCGSLSTTWAKWFNIHKGNFKK